MAREYVPVPIEYLSEMEPLSDENFGRLIRALLRYGLDGSEPLTQKEIAAQLGISRSYVSRIETKALKKLKKRFDSSSNLR